MAEMIPRLHAHPATLLPYPGDVRLRPVVLRPIFSDGLPLSDTTYFGNYLVLLKKIKRCISCRRKLGVRLDIF
jgi:hypothetical protein